MNQGDRHRSRIDDRLFGILDEHVACGRVTEIVTDAVPSRFPGQLLVCVSGLSASTVDSDAAFEAAAAVELAWLHQYLHSIPVANGQLRPPAARSPYDGDAVAAILDGDVLQARAFGRLSSAIDDPKTTKRCYRLLSRASVDSYQRLSETDTGPDATTFAPITGVAARIGAVLGGVDRSTGAFVERSARSIAAAVPVQTPTGRRHREPPGSAETAVQDLVDAVAVSPSDGERLERLVDRTRPSPEDR